MCVDECELSGSISRVQNVSYQQLKEEARPLDLVVIASKNFIPQLLSRLHVAYLGVGGTWNHVGVIFPSRYIDFPNRVEDELYTWEAVISGVYPESPMCVETGKPYFGLQLQPLSGIAYENISKGGSIGLIRLADNPFAGPQEGEGSKEYLQRLASALAITGRFIHRYHGKPFDRNLVNWAGVLIRPVFYLSPGSNRLNRDVYLFCSQFIVMLYQRHGIIPPRPNPKRVSPEELIYCVGELCSVEPATLWRLPQLSVDSLDGISDIPHSAKIRAEASGSAVHGEPTRQFASVHGPGKELVGASHLSEREGGEGASSAGGRAAFGQTAVEATGLVEGPTGGLLQRDEGVVQFGEVDLTASGEEAAGVVPNRMAGCVGHTSGTEAGADVAYGGAARDPGGLLAEAGHETEGAGSQEEDQAQQTEVGTDPQALGEGVAAQRGQMKVTASQVALVELTAGTDDVSKRSAGCSTSDLQTEGSWGRPVEEGHPVGQPLREDLDGQADGEVQGDTHEGARQSNSTGVAKERKWFKPTPKRKKRVAIYRQLYGVEVVGKVGTDTTVLRMVPRKKSDKSVGLVWTADLL